MPHLTRKVVGFCLILSKYANICPTKFNNESQPPIPINDFPLKQSPNVEIRAIDQEVLENLLAVDGCLAEHDLHDKIVVASAMTLECPIITVDHKIIEFVGSGERKIPNVLN